MVFRFSMKAAATVAALLGGLAAAPVSAHDTEALSMGRLLTNDFFGDGRDRWQTGSYAISVLRRTEPWTDTSGQAVEYRLRSQTIAPNGLGGEPDRSYVGALSLGLHRHTLRGRTQTRFGFDVTAIGPQTGLSAFQRDFHERYGLEPVRFTDQQLSNDLLFGVSAETAEVMSLSPTMTLRPFGEVQVGPEDTVRVGADLIIGDPMTDNILIRDVTTGHLYRGRPSQSGRGVSLVLGADFAAIAESAFLPDSGAGAATQTRTRVRAGVHMRRSERLSLFYGVTYLSPEFDGQDEGQVVGSLTLNFNF